MILQALRMVPAGLLLLMASVAGLEAQEADVTFFVIGKHASFSQDVSSGLNPVDYSFFAEIFLSRNGDASNAQLILPTGVEIAFVDQRQAEGGKRDNILLVSGKARYGSFAALQADYPDGEYQISFATPSGPVRYAKLLFRGESLPTAPRILLRQDGATVCTRVDAASDLRVSWSPFAEGGPDPDGVLDDLIFVILAKEDGTRVAHSGRPFENTPFLNYSAAEFIIPAGSMESGHNYVLSVEHAILDDTRTYKGVPAMTTRAVTTKMFISAGEAPQAGGQKRKRRPIGRRPCDQTSAQNL